MMEAKTTDKLQSIVAALDEYIDVVRTHNLHETVHLLKIAKLDLQMKVHAISDYELRELCRALERHGVDPDPASTRGATAAPCAEGTATVISLRRPIVDQGETVASRPLAQPRRPSVAAARDVRTRWHKRLRTRPVTAR